MKKIYNEEIMRRQNLFHISINYTVCLDLGACVQVELVKGWRWRVYRATSVAVPDGLDLVPVWILGELTLPR